MRSDGANGRSSLRPACVSPDSRRVVTRAGPVTRRSKPYASDSRATRYSPGLSYSASRSGSRAMQRRYSSYSSSRSHTSVMISTESIPGTFATRTSRTESRRRRVSGASCAEGLHQRFRRGRSADRRRHPQSSSRRWCGSWLPSFSNAKRAGEVGLLLKSQRCHRTEVTLLDRLHTPPQPFLFGDLAIDLSVEVLDGLHRYDLHRSGS